MRFRFLKPVLILTVALAAVLAYPYFVWLEAYQPEIRAAFIVGLLNGVIGLTVIELTLEKSNTVFMTAFFGSTGIRVLATLITFGVLLASGYDGLTLTLFLMGAYFAYLSVEVYVLSKVLSRYGKVQIGKKQ